MPSVSTDYRRAATFALLLLGGLVAAASATTFKQPGFSESVVFTGLTNPAVVRFLPDGRVLVAEKSGILKVFPNLTTNTYTIVGDLRTKTHNFWDRGMLGLAVPPGFDPASPDEWRRYVYVLYAHDAPIGGTAPKWGVVDGTSDPCPGPPGGPGATADGCLVSGRLSRLPADGNNWTEAGEEEVLLEDWCQQYPSHSTGALDFGADEKLYVSGGDGASFGAADWGQFGGVHGVPPYTPANPCADPPFALGTPQTKPTARGGALRSQSLLRPPGEARLLNGAILRIDPSTGDPLPDNPLFSSSDPNEQRTIAYGLRNPFRMIVRPGTNEVFVADVGWGTWEELNRIPDLSVARNFGWPCFEGNATQYTGLDICPAQAQTVAPLLTYHHSLSLVPGDGCSVGSSSIAGMAFYQGGSNYPAEFENALFFSDYSRKCMWVMFPDGAGNPSPALTEAFANTVSTGAVDLQIGPDGNLYYVDFNGGRIMRIKYGLSAAASANPTSGTAPLLVDFDGSATAPAQVDDELFYAWDLDGDGEYDDSTEVSPSHTYTTPGNYTARLRVTDERGAIDFSDPIPISAGNTAPTAVIDTPLSSLTWKVNDTITFGGHGDDAQEENGEVPEANLEWVVRIQHCPSDCHPHTYQTFSGVAGGSFPAPDHEYPAHLEIELTATDTQGLSHTTTVPIHPETVSLEFLTSPPGLQLSVGTATSTAPFTRTVIQNSGNAVDALAPQGTFPNVWDFASWSDGGAPQHSITASASATYTATYATHADLSISVSDSPEPVGAGAGLTYSVTVANAGPSQANSLSVTHGLPAGTSFQSASGTGWACSGTGPVTCTMDSLGLAAAAPIAILVTAPAAAGDIIANSSVSASTADSATANNSVSTTSTVFARADLSVTQSGAPASICTGQPITYTLNASNTGPSAAASVSITDVLPAGAALVSASGTGWACSGTASVTCTRDALAVGAAPAITVAITAPTSAQTATNSVSVTSVTNDPSAANNSSVASTTVNAVPAPPTAGNGGAVCAGGTLQLSASTVAGATYAWTGPNGFTSPLQNPTIPNATLAASGLYSVTVTVNACTSAPATSTATVRTLPTATVSGGAAICPGGSTTIQAALTGTGPWTVVWSDGVTQSNVAASPASRNVSPAATTTYTVTSVNDAHCAGTDTGSATVTVRPRPTAVAGGTAEVCAGGSTPLSGSGGVSCAWAPATGLSNPSSCSPTASPSATTTYTLTVTDANGCVSDNAPAVTVTVNPIPSPPAATNSGETCAGDPLQLFASAVAGASYAWTGPNGFSSTLQNPTIPNATPAASGTYSVTVTVAGCTSAAATTTAHVHPIPAGVVSGSATICAGSSATIQAALTGTGPWTVTWSDGVTQNNVPTSPVTRNVSPAVTTTYTITTFRDIYCEGTDTGAAVITVAPTPTAAVTGTAQVCAGDSTQIQAALTGTGPWTVVWSDGVTQSNVAASPATRNVTPAATTTYTVTAVSDASCAGGAGSGSAVVTVRPRPTAAVTGGAQICAGGSTTIQAALTGTGPWTVVWSDGATQSNVPASPATRNVSPAATTTYTAVSVNDANCSGTTSGSAVVTITPQPTATVSGTAQVCAGTSTVIQAALTGAGPWTVVWSDGVTQSNVAASPATRTVSPAATTTYTVTSIDDASCAGTSSGSAVVTVTPRPTAAASGAAEICAGASTPLSGDGGVSCLWAPAAGLSNPASCAPSASPAATTTYTLAVTDATGCVSTNTPTVTIVVEPRPTAVVSGSAAVCAGSSTTIQAALTGAGPWTVVWSDSFTQPNVAASPATRSVSPGATTTYTVTSVTDTNCAGTASGSAVVTVSSRPTAVASGSAEICAGASTPLSGSGGVSCLWAPATGLSNPSSCAPTATPAATTTYTLTVTDASGCVSTNSPAVTVTVEPRPTAAVTGGAAICPGGSTSIQAALTGAGPWAVVWSDGFTQPNVAASPASRSVSPAATTTYTVTSVTDTNCAGTASGSAVVTVSPRPTAAASGTAEICPGGATALSGSGGVSCLWAPAAGLSDPTSCAPTATPAATTTYTLTVTDASGCVSNNAPAVTITVNPIPSPPAAGNGGEVCAGETLQLTASTVAGASYAWTGPNGFVSALQNPTIPNATPAASGTYSVSVTVAGCASSAATTNALVRPPPTALVSGAATICAGDSTQLSAVLTGTGPWNLTWSDGHVQSAGTSPAIRNVSPPETTTYTVTAIADAHCAGPGAGAAEIVVGTPVDSPPITAPLSAAVNATGLAASVTNHEGSTYAWTVSAGTITSGQGSNAITFDAASPGTTMTLSVVETNTACSSPTATHRLQVDFLDVPPPHMFHDYVNTIARNGVTAGCGAGNYCPGASNTREQMAVFLLKSKFGPDHVPPPAVGLFSDVPVESPFAPWVEEVAALQISVGCGGGKYCPGVPVTRGQMAVFLLKTLLGFDYAPPAATGALFGDVAAGSFGAAWIEDLYNRGVTGGCQSSPLLYCPSTPVTRGQMAVFLVRTFGL